MQRTLTGILALAALASAQRFPLSIVSSGDNAVFPYSLAEDRDGSLWVGASRLFRFDGRSLVDFGSRLGLPQAAVGLVRTDHAGNPWVTTAAGLYRIENLHASLVSSKLYSGIEFLAHGLLLSSNDPSGDTPLEWLDLDEFTRTGHWQATPLAVRGHGGLYLDAEGSVWFGCEYGICELENAGREARQSPSVKRYREAQGLPRDQWNDVLRDGSGRIWTRSGYRVFVADARSRSFVAVPGTQSTSGDASGIFLDETRSIWFSGSEGILHDEGGRRTFFPAKSFGPVMPGNFRSLLREEQDDIWLGSRAGLARWVGNGAITVWGKDEGLPDVPIDVARIRGKDIYAGTFKGVYRLAADQSRWTVVPGTEGIGPWRLVDEEPDGSLLAIFSLAKAFSLKGKLVRLQTPPELKRAGVSTASYQGKVYQMLPQRYTGGKATDLVFPADPRKVRGFKIDRDHNLWLATMAGLFVTDLKGKWRHFGQEDGLLDNALQAVGTAPDGAVWIGYDLPIGFTRMSYLGADLTGKAEWRNFTSPVRDTTESTLFFGFDRQGHVWRGTGAGIHLCDGVHLDLADWVRLTSEDGLIDNDGVLGGFFLDRDGSVWISTGKGITRFASTTDLFRERQVRAFVSDRQWTSPDHRAIRISVGVSPLSLTRKVNIEYRVLPQKQNWIPAAGLDIDLTGLSGGSHRFEARVVESRWIKAAGVASTSFETTGHLSFWWWGAALAAGGFGLYFWRRRRQQVEYWELKDQFLRLKDASPEERERLLQPLPERHRTRLTAMLADAAPATTLEDDAAGAVIAGRFVIEHRMAKGGFATVYFGRDLQCNRDPVAIKLIRFRPDLSEWINRRWKLEQKALESLRHPGILQPREAGITDDDQLFIVTEYIEGVTVQAVLTRGPMELGRAWTRTREVCEALEYAHVNSILHCDLKPDNIMLRNVGQANERAVVIDFGTAVFCAPDHSILDSGRAAGAPDYMAPDRLGGTLSTATDVYSLALVVFEMLTGVRWRDAEAGGRTEALLQQVLPHSVTDERCVRLVTVFRNASAFDAHARTRTVAEFQRLLSFALDRA